MHKRTVTAMTAVGLVAAIAIPTIAFGNARNNLGSLNFMQAANTPYTARLAGANEVPPPGDVDGTGAAAVTFDTFDRSVANGSEVCWDLTYSGIVSPPTMAHIHRGAAGVGNGPIEVPFIPTGDVGFEDLGVASATGCRLMPNALADEIRTNPGNFYVNVHTTDLAAGAIRGQLAAGAKPAGEAHLLPVPLRAYDSRDANGPKLAALETRTINLTTGKDFAGTVFMALPPGATAAIVTLTVTETVGPGGFLKLYSAALTTQPATSAVNWAGTNQNLATTTQVAVDELGQVKVTGGANSTHFVVDVVGYLF